MLDYTKNLRFIFLACTGATLGNLSAAETVKSPNLEQTIKETYVDTTEEPGAVLFNPPQGWGIADPKMLPPSVKIMVVGKGSGEFPPSMHMVVEPWKGTLKEYLKKVKAINEARKDEWKDLGKIRTQGGDASLSQVDSKSKWGEIREMHLILLHNEIIYILSAAALKEDFNKFYKDFFTAFRSFRINKDAFEMLSNPSKKENLTKAITNLKHEWNLLLEDKEKSSKGISSKELADQLFHSPAFQENRWSQFTGMITREYADMGPVWQKHVITTTQQELLN
jgi:hypothetical protein